MHFETIRLAVEAARPLILAAERHIWRHPETGYREWKTHEFLKAQMEALGLSPRTFDRIPASIAVQSAKAGQDRVFKPIPGFWVDIDTGRPGPRLAIFGEMDSLLIPTHPESDKETGAVHACGHHAQCAALLGVAAGLSAPGALDGLSGSIRLIAVPAEEFIERDFRAGLRDRGVIRYLGGKQELLWRGILDDVDLAYLVHTTAGTARLATAPGSNGFIATKHIFLGKAAHAGSKPHEGVNALYAANLAMNAVNALRETFRDDQHVRFHPIITEGGTSCNSIPERVCVESSVRAASVQTAVEVNAKVNRAFAGAAVAMGCRLEVHDLNGYAPRLNDPSLNDLFHDVAVDLFGADCKHERAAWSSGCSDMGDISCVMPATNAYAGGAVGRGHGSDYGIADPEIACVGSAMMQAESAARLLADDASLARSIVAKAAPPCRTIADYLHLADSIELDGEVVAYGDDGRVTISFDCGA
jgi:amidohydrolase